MKPRMKAFKSIDRIFRKARLLLRRKSPEQVRATILLATVILALFPFWLANGHGSLSHSLSNKALGAADAAVRARLLQDMSGGERSRYGRMVRDRLFEDPDSFLKMGGEDIAMVFSRPSLKRIEGDTQIWQYRSGVCVLDLFIDGGNVVYYEMRRPGKAVLRGPADKALGGVPDPSACLKAIIRI